MVFSTQMERELLKVVFYCFEFRFRLNNVIFFSDFDSRRTCSFCGVTMPTSFSPNQQSAVPHIKCYCGSHLRDDDFRWAGGTRNTDSGFDKKTKKACKFGRCL